MVPNGILKLVGIATAALLIISMVSYSTAQIPIERGEKTKNEIKLDKCEGQIDLSTGSTNNFIAKAPGSIESGPTDWNSLTSNALYAVNPYPGWYNGPEVGTYAMWVTPFTDEQHDNANGYGDFRASFSFNATDDGKVVLYIAADDAVDIYLDGNLIGSHNTFKKLKQISVDVKQGSHTILASVDDRHAVVSGLLIIGWYCPYPNLISEEVITKNLHFSAEVDRLTVLQTPKNQWILLKEISCLIQDSDAWQADKTARMVVFIDNADVKLECKGDKPAFNADHPMQWIKPGSEIKVTTNDGGVYEVDLWIQIYGYEHKPPI